MLPHGKSTVVCTQFRKCSHHLVAPCIIKWHNFKVLVFFFKVKEKIGYKQNNSQYQQ